MSAVVTGLSHFRIRAKQQPIYSSGAIALLQLPEASPRLCLVSSCESVLNLIDARTGVRLGHYDIPLDDPVLHLDVVPVLTVETASQIEASSQQTSTERTSLKAIAHIAASTKSLQLCILAVERTKMVADPSKDAAEEYTLRPVKMWTAAQHAIGCIRFSPSASTLASGSTDGMLSAWNAVQHHITHNIRVKGGIITCLHFDDRESWLVVGTFEGVVSLIDFKGKSVAASAKSHTAAVEAAKIYTSGDTGDVAAVVTVGRDRKIVVCDRQLVEIRVVAMVDYVTAATFDASGLAYIGTTNGTTAVYAAEPEGQIAALRRSEPVSTQKGEDADIRDEGTVMSISAVPLLVGGTEAASIAPDAREGSHVFIAVAYANRCIDLFAAPRCDSSSTPMVPSTSLVCNLGQVLDIKAIAQKREASDSGPSICRVVVTNSRDVYVFPSVSGCASPHVLRGHTDIVLSCDASTDGAYIVTGGKDTTVRAWSRQKGGNYECVGVGQEGGHASEVTCVSLRSQDSGLLFCSGGMDEALRMWTVPKQKSTGVAALHPVCGVDGSHQGSVHCVAFSPNGEYVSSGGKDKAVCLWTVQRQGKKLVRKASLLGHKRAINCIAFSEADRVLASASNDGTIRIWALATGSCARTLQVDKSAILQISFFNQGTQVASSSVDGLVRVWAVSTGECITTVDAHEDKVWALSVVEQAGRTYFISGGADSTIVVAEDYTAEETERLRQERKQTVQLEQELSNQLREGNYSKAFTLALQLKHTRHLKQVLSVWLTRGGEQAEAEIATTVGELSAESREKLLECSRDWMANARTCHIASVVVHGLLQQFHPSKLVDMSELQYVLEALISYSRRHVARISQQVQQLHYVDYVCRRVAPPDALLFDAPQLPADIVEDAHPATEEATPVVAHSEPDLAAHEPPATVVDAPKSTTKKRRRQEK